VRIAASGTVFRSLNGSIRACAFNAVRETHGLDSSQRLSSWFSLESAMVKRTRKIAKEIAGPSATADIEGVLIHGAQGVRSLTIVPVPRPAKARSTA
jgi:hypothetical protein